MEDGARGAAPHVAYEQLETTKMLEPSYPYYGAVPASMRGEEDDDSPCGSEFVPWEVTRVASAVNSVRLPRPTMTMGGGLVAGADAGGEVTADLEVCERWVLRMEAVYSALSCFRRIVVDPGREWAQHPPEPRSFRPCCWYSVACEILIMNLCAVASIFFSFFRHRELGLGFALAALLLAVRILTEVSRLKRFVLSVMATAERATNMPHVYCAILANVEAWREAVFANLDEHTAWLLVARVKLTLRPLGDQHDAATAEPETRAVALSIVDAPHTANAIAGRPSPRRQLFGEPHVLTAFFASPLLVTELQNAKPSRWWPQLTFLVLVLGLNALTWIDRSLSFGI
jgi:hypothetical protein